MKNLYRQIGILFVVFALLVIATSPCASLAGSAQTQAQLSSDGSMPGVTVERTNVYRSQALAEPKTTVWRTEKLFTLNPPNPIPVNFDKAVAGYIINSTNYFTDPLVVDGTIYFTFRAKDAFLFAVDTSTGKEKKRLKWSSETISAAAIAGNMIYLAGNGGSIFAIDRNDYKEKWRIAKPGYWFTDTSPAVADGLLFFGGTDGEHNAMRRPKGVVVAIDAANGQGKWFFATKGIPTSVAYSAGVAFFGDEDNHLFAVNCKTGQQVWVFKAPNNVGIPAVMGDSVYFSDAQGHLSAVDKGTGQQRWRTTKVRSVASPLALYNGMIYYAGEKRNITAVDAATGAQKWDYNTTKECTTPVVADGTVYFISADKFLNAVDATTGELKWKYKVEHNALVSPVIANGTAYLLDEEGLMYAIK